MTFIQRGKLCAFLLLLAAACGPGGKGVLMRFDGSPDDALVTVNDRYIGKLGRLEKAGLLVPPGEYRVTIEQVGYFPQDQLVVVTDTPPAPIHVELTEIPD
jgi:hypothetical protein